VQSDARLEREQLELDRRYGQIGISAVKPALNEPAARELRRGC
jgi:hypothetical protein